MPRNRRPNFPVPIVQSDDESDNETASSALIMLDHLLQEIKYLIEGVYMYPKLMILGLWI